MTAAKRILLLYITEVSGHHSATLAIEKALRALDPSAEILNINAFKYTNPVSEKIVNRLYLGIIKRMPKVWDYLYDNPTVVKRINRLRCTVNRFNSLKLKKLFDQFKPDAVACTQAFPCGMVAEYKMASDSNIPLVAVLTDYVPHSYWIYDRVNFYVVPSADVGERLARKGVWRSKIKPLGIPFDPKFTQASSRSAIARHLGLDDDVPTVLIMGGGQGLGPITAVIRSLDTIRHEFQKIIVCGTNKHLYRSLKKQTRTGGRKTVVYGYAHNVHELMDVADLIITKPGGITTAEALAKGLPMIIIKPIPGQEENNTSYLTQHQAAIKVDDPGAVADVIDELLAAPEKLHRLRAAAREIAKPDASRDIARLLLESASGAHA